MPFSTHCFEKSCEKVECWIKQKSYKNWKYYNIVQNVVAWGYVYLKGACSSSSELRSFWASDGNRTPDLIAGIITFDKKTYIGRELWLVNTRVWIRVSDHGKSPAKSLLKFALHVGSYNFVKEIRNGFCVSTFEKLKTLACTVSACSF